jgi:hypothetical protein
MNQDSIRGAVILLNSFKAFDDGKVRQANTCRVKYNKDVLLKELGVKKCKFPVLKVSKREAWDSKWICNGNLTSRGKTYTSSPEMSA